MDFDRLLEKQKELMSKVPHAVRTDVLARMETSHDLVRALLVYINSQGHKPWRPNPLAPNITFANLNEVIKHTSDLTAQHTLSVSTTLLSDTYIRRLISMFGIIEEAIEYVDSTMDPNKTPADHLEELTDGLFFQLEQIAMSGFTLDEIEAEYDRKHAVNLQRYADAEKGNWDWDKRGETNGL